MNPPRQWPLRVRPLPGEALDSWIAAIARRHRLTIGALLTGTGIAQIRVRRHTVTDQDLLLLAQLTASDVAELRDRYSDSQHLEVDGYHAYAAARRINPAWSRFCPNCLRDSDGRWALAWRRPWTFACLDHNKLLVARCPQCALPGHHSPALRVAPLGYLCNNRYSPSPMLPKRICGFDLRLAPQPPLPGSKKTADTQRTLTECVQSSPEAVVAAIDGITITTAQFWEDLRVVVDDTLRHLPPVEFRRDSLAPDELLYRSRYAGVERAAPIDIARAATNAHQVLRSPTREAIALLSPLMRTGASINVGPDGTLRAGRALRDLSPGLDRVIRGAVAPRLPTLERLRCAAETQNPYSHAELLEAMPLSERARCLPAHIWPAWRVRLLPQAHRDHVRLASALSQALCLVGRLGSPEAAAAAFAPAATRSQPSLDGRVWRRLDSSVRADLCRLARHLDESDVPIDYSRRRRVFATDQLITHEEWRTICKRLGLAVRPPSHALASLFLTERLTGTLVEAGIDGPLRASYRAFARRLPASLLAALDEHAAQLLNHVGIDEPLIWQPPVTILGRPGTGKTPPQAAPVLAAPLEHAAATRARRQHTTIPRTGPMSPGSIAGDYVARGRSMAVIATDRGCSRQTVARIVREEAGVTPRTNTRRWHIDEPWFRRRYFDDGQTTETIAAELGCSQSTVERFARERAITLRKRGGRHQVAVPPAGAQAILRRAVTDAHSLQRLARFRLLAAGATISAVAASEGLSASTFVTQLQRLERDCGRRLLTRAERGKPLRVTAAGRQLLAAMAATPVTAEAGDLGYPQRQVS